MTVYNKASLVLAESPAYKAGKIQPHYPLTPDVSFDFTRATSATRVNASGNIEKETQNLLLQSNQFDTTWTTSASDLTSNQTGYDGTSDAWLLTAAIPSVFSSRINQVLSPSASGVLNFSVYAKANTLDWILLDGLGTNGFAAWFDIRNGVKGQVISTSIGSKITSVGNGWYRCEVFGNATTLTEVRIYVTDNNGTTTANDGDGCYIQDAQLEQGLVARNYQETTTAAFYGGITDNIPRLDYTDSSCPSVLLEPQRTNLSIQSEYITGSGAPLAIQSAGMTISYNQTTSPESVDNAMKWTEASNNGLHWGGLFLTGTSVGDDLTISIFAKRGTSDDRDIIINIYDGAISDRARYNLDAGTIVTDSAASNQPVVSMEDYGNGWWRCIYTRNLANSGYNAVVGLVNGTAPSWQGNGTSNIYTYGLQYEVGSYATSYIPTYGTSVTRNADFPTTNINTNITDSTQGSVYFEFQSISSTSTDVQNYFTLNTGTSDSIRFGVQSAGGIFRAKKDGVNLFSQGFAITDPTAVNKIAFRWGLNDWKLYLNGSVVYTSTSMDTFESGDLTKLENGINNALGFLGNVRELVVFPTRLSDDECIALTTL